jgi:hypothetical protein
MRARVFFLLLLSAGCTHVQINSGNPASSTVPNTSAGLQVQANGGVAAVVVVGAIVATGLQDSTEPSPFVRYSSFSDWLWPARAPELSPDRTVSEQDCTKPIQLSGNLRCR